MAMAKPITHVFSEINEGKYKSVKHYELIEVKNGTTQLSEQINISKDRNCAKSMPDYWLKIKNGNKWSKCITGLFKTGLKDIYRGDVDRKKHLVVFRFTDDASVLIIYYYENYYTDDLSNLFA